MAWYPMTGASVDLLSEVTYGEHNNTPMIEKTNSGRMSPIRGRTMKEIDQQIAELKKENFNLKLRIYFLEERMNFKYKDDEIIKTNIQLNMEILNYKADIQQKQQLIERASETIDNLTSKYSTELEKDIKQGYEAKILKSDQRVAELEIEMQSLVDKIQTQTSEHENLQEDVDNKIQQIQLLKGDLDDRDREIEDLSDQVKHHKIEMATVTCTAQARQDELREELDRLQMNVGRRDRDVKDEVEDTMRNVEKWKQKCSGQEQQLSRKDDMIAKMEDLLRKREKDIQALQKQYDERMLAYNKAKHGIQKLVDSLCTEQEKGRGYENKIKDMEDEIVQLKDQLSEKQTDKKKDTQKIEELETNSEQLARTLGRKDGELEKFQVLLKKAETSLALSEAAVESLEKQLKHDTTGQQASSGSEDLGRLRHQISQLQRELDDRDKQYQSKCEQLDQLLNFLQVRGTVDHSVLDEIKLLVGQSSSTAVPSVHVTVNSPPRGNYHECHTHVNHVSAADRMNAADGGKVGVTTPTNAATQTDHVISPFGHVTSPFGHVTSPFGHVTAQPDHVISPFGHVTAQSDHLMSKNGHMTDHVISQQHEADRHSPQDDIFTSKGQQQGAVGAGGPMKGGKNGSRIPVRRSSSTCSMSDDLDTIKGQMTELTAHNQHLQNTLKATEETVHCQTQKMKAYKNMLIEHGLVPRSRSNSVPSPRLGNLVGGSGSLSPPTPEEGSRGRVRERSMSSVDLLHHGDVTRRSLSPNLSLNVNRSRSPSIISAETDNKLHKQNSKLRQQIKNYQKILQVFQGRSSSPNSDLEKYGTDVDRHVMEVGDRYGTDVDSGLRAMNSGESATCMVDNWLDILNQGVMELPTSPRQVDRLRRGLQQIQNAIQTLHDTSHAIDAEGRLSPDSGCSDNAMSNPNTLKSPLDSPTDSFHKSLITSPPHMATSPRSANRHSATTSPYSTNQHAATSPLHLTGSLSASAIDRVNNFTKITSPPSLVPSLHSNHTTSPDHLTGSPTSGIDRVNSFTKINVNPGYMLSKANTISNGFDHHYNRMPSESSDLSLSNPGFNLSRSKTSVTSSCDFDKHSDKHSEMSEPNSRNAKSSSNAYTGTNNTDTNVYNSNPAVVNSLQDNTVSSAADQAGYSSASQRLRACSGDSTQHSQARGSSGDMERLRHCGDFTDNKDFSMTSLASSQPHDSVFTSNPRGCHGIQTGQGHMDPRMSYLTEVDSMRNVNPESLRYHSNYIKSLQDTLTASMLESVGDNTLNVTGHPGVPAIVSPNNKIMSPGNQYTSPSNQQRSPSNQQRSPSNQQRSPSNQHSSPSNQQRSPNKMSPPGSQMNDISHLGGFYNVNEIENVNDASKLYSPANKANLRGGRLNPSVFSTTLSGSFLHGVGDQTMMEGNTSIVACDQLLQDISLCLMKDQETKLEMRQTLENITKKTRTHRDAGTETNTDTEKELFNLLHRLQLQIEKGLKENENLLLQLQDFSHDSMNIICSQDRRISELEALLANNNLVIKQKMELISEKDRSLRQVTESLSKQQTEYIRDTADLQTYKDRVHDLKTELESASSTKDKLSSRCSSLIQAVEQYKKRAEQLTDDNKKFMEAVYRQQNKVKDVEDEWSGKLVAVEKAASDTELNLKSRVEQLESDMEQLHENEDKYKTLLCQARAQVNKLSMDNKVVKDNMDKKDHELKDLHTNLAKSRDTVEDQSRQLCDRRSIIDNLNQELRSKENILRDQDNMCQNIKQKMERISTENARVCRELKQQTLTCSEYKSQVQSQNELTRDLQNETRRLRDQLDTAIASRDRKASELEESDRLKDKYLKNATLLLNELKRVKKEYREEQKRLQETVTVISQLMITQQSDNSHQSEVLKLLNLLNQRLPTIIEQNQEINVDVKAIFKNWSDTITHARRQLEESRQRIPGDMCDSASSSETSLDGAANMSWPWTSDLCGDLRAVPDNFSTSLPLSESPNPLTSRRGVSDGGSLPLSRKGSGSQGYGSQGSAGSQCGSQGSGSQFGSQQCFSVPGPIYKQGISDECLIYNVNDSPKHLASLTKVRIDSDLRSVFAIGMIEHFEKLRKETNECQAILKGVSVRLGERLKTFVTMPATESVEYSTLKELAYSTENMRICVDIQQSVIGCFWTSELPAPNERGEFVNQKQLDKITSLKMELAQLRCKHDTESSQEANLCKSLESTLGVVTQARHNLQQTHIHSASSSPLHSPRK